MLIPDPPEGLPDTLVPLYEEARAVVEASPASACALLRLLLSALLIREGRPGRHLNRDVNALVAHGAPVGLLRASTPSASPRRRPAIPGPSTSSTATPTPRTCSCS